jgi:hypothetical protein
VFAECEVVVLGGIGFGSAAVPFGLPRGWQSGKVLINDLRELVRWIVAGEQTRQFDNERRETLER